MNPPRPLVLVHGLGDTPQVFRRLEQRLDQHRIARLAPHLPHRLGAVPLRDLARLLETHIKARWGREEIDLLGFSMGGVIGRIWLQELGGAQRCRRFISVGSPQQGTYTAQPVPRWLFAGIADMKRNSPLLQHLNAECSALQTVDCVSLYSRWDLMVVPGWEAVLPVGDRQEVPVVTHDQLMGHPRAINQLIRIILKPLF
ncbi:MAG: esterase/lipase family protein [Synechococcus sp.]